MAKPETEFKSGDVVSIKGKSGTHVVSYPMIMSTPSIVDGQFCLLPVEFYKFITKTETFYAYGRDLKTAKKK